MDYFRTDETDGFISKTLEYEEEEIACKFIYHDARENLFKMILG